LGGHSVVPDVEAESERAVLEVEAQDRFVDEAVERGPTSLSSIAYAAQMLEWMVVTPTGTRTEATDVANALFDLTSAATFSAETVVGAGSSRSPSCARPVTTRMR
jgi:pyruvate kinase